MTDYVWTLSDAVGVSELTADTDYVLCLTNSAWSQTLDTEDFDTSAVPEVPIVPGGEPADPDSDSLHGAGGRRAQPGLHRSLESQPRRQDAPGRRPAGMGGRVVDRGSGGRRLLEESHGAGAGFVLPLIVGIYAADDIAQRVVLVALVAVAGVAIWFYARLSPA